MVSQRPGERADLLRALPPEVTAAAASVGTEELAERLDEGDVSAVLTTFPALADVRGRVPDDPSAPATGPRIGQVNYFGVASARPNSMVAAARLLETDNLLVVPGAVYAAFGCPLSPTCFWARAGRAFAVKPSRTYT